MDRNDHNALTVQPIGVVRSVYRLCVGTPRQGLLAPHARGRIELFNDNNSSLLEASDAVDGLSGFSHVWIVFAFHLNTVGTKTPSKIAPPAAGGARVGVLATRSPHRGNPIGLTLVQLGAVRHDKIVTAPGQRPRLQTYLEVSGLDLVDGTPVLDVKPYVPAYDAPPGATAAVVPPWVAQGLATQRPVELSEAADNQLRAILENNSNALEFYGRHGESVEEALDHVTACIREVLAMDVRSKWQTNKARQGNFKAERSNRLQQQELSTDSGRAASSFSNDDNDTCTQQIDNLLVRFTVQDAGTVRREASLGSGAEDVVFVHSIELFRPAAADNQ